MSITDRVASIAAALALPLVVAPLAKSAKEPSRQSATVSEETVRGRVLDAQGRPVAGAEICAAGRTQIGVVVREGIAPNELVERAVADALGQFTVSVPSSGGPPFAVVARAPGHGPRIELDLYGGDEIEMVLPPAARMTGRVYDTLGNRVAGARVHWMASYWGTVLESDAVSQEDGSYALEDLLPTWTADRWIVLAEADGYAPLTVELPSVGWAKAGLVAWTESEVIQHLVLSRGAVVEGQVEDADLGTAIAGAEVVLWSLEGRTTYRDEWTEVSPWIGDRVLGRTRSDDDGSFVFEHVPVNGFHGSASHNGNRSGTLLGGLIATANGWSTARVDVPLLEDFHRVQLSLDLERTDAPQVAMDRFDLRPDPRLTQRPRLGTNRLRGTLADRDGRPLQMGTVLVFDGSLTREQIQAWFAAGLDNSLAPIACNRPRANGRFEVRNLPDGFVWVGGPTASGTPYLERVELPTDFLALASDAPNSLRSNARCIARVLDQSGFPLELDAFLFVPENDSGNIQDDWADPWRSVSSRRGAPTGTGKYAIPQIPVGRYSFLVHAPGHRLHRESSVLVENGTVFERVVTLEPEGRIRGLVKGLEHSRGDQPRVELRHESGARVSAPVDATGQFDAESVGPGDYRVEFSDRGKNQATSACSNRPVKVQVDEGAPLTVTEFTLVPAAVLELRIVDPTLPANTSAFGAAAGLTLQLVSTDGTEWEENRALGFGRENIGLPPGDYVVRLLRHGEVFEQHEVSLSLESGPVVLEAGYEQ